ncbi:uncharacterized protein LOC114948409, partial [Acropora millepora]|uniref:uncharacterized protein LOC114948409 n=1 Tax=Acropora millepora TaxID=45264 RepID=UPI001CF2D863
TIHISGLLLFTERCEYCSKRMALIPRFAFFALLLLPHQSEAKAEKCSETQCLLLPDGDDPVASEFHCKACQKGVLLVYINLVIGNASYDPLELPDVFLPHRWVWANTINEPMLSLRDDYDILSLGLLDYQVRSIDVKLKDHPSGCLAKLNSTCQNQVVGRMLLENVTSSISGDVLHKKTPVVCVALINRSLETVRYHCCDIHKEATGPATIRCDQRVDKGDWRSVAILFFYLMSISLTLYSAALPLALPDYVFSLEDEVEKENRLRNPTYGETTRGEHDNQRGSGANQYSGECGEASEFILLDDSSPMNVSTLLRKLVHRWPAMPLSFNTKLAFLLLYVYPCASYFQLLLYPTLKEMHLKECRNKQVSFQAVTSFFLLPGLSPSMDEWQPLLIFIVVILILALPVLFLNPMDFVIPGRIRCPLCKKYKEENMDEFHFVHRCFMGDEIRRHLKIMFKFAGNCFRIFLRCVCRWGMWLISLTICNQESRLSRAICVVLILIGVPFGILILITLSALSVVCFTLYFCLGGFLFSPFVTSLTFCEINFFGSSYTRFIKMCLLGALSVPIIYWVSITSLSCFISVLGHTMLGVTLNISIVSAFVIFFRALKTNLYLCYENMQNKYKDVKKIISEVPICSSPEDTTISTLIENYAISAKLYWFVCERVLPHEYELLIMLRNMILVSVYLCLALSSIVSFGIEYDFSTVTFTLSSFLTSSIPSLFLKAQTMNTNISKSERFKMEREIDEAVRCYIERNAEAVEEQSQETTV